MQVVNPDRDIRVSLEKKIGFLIISEDLEKQIETQSRDDIINRPLWRCCIESWVYSLTELCKPPPSLSHLSRCAFTQSSSSLSESYHVILPFWAFEHYIFSDRQGFLPISAFWTPNFSFKIDGAFSVTPHRAGSPCLPYDLIPPSSVLLLSGHTRIPAVMTNCWYYLFTYLEKAFS